MFVNDRFHGPLADLWPDLDAAAGLLRDARLPVPDCGDRAAWQSSLLNQPALSWLKASAATEFGRPWSQPLAHSWARFRRDGDREEYQQALFARQARLRRAVLMAAVTGDDAWCDEAADGLVLACEQLGWCWPAHDEFGGALGWVLPNPDDPFLDLGASEMAADLAWADAALGSRLDSRWPGLRELLRAETWRRVMAPFLSRRDWWWIDGREGAGHGPNNWNPWIHANLIAAAIGLVDDPCTRPKVIALALDGLDRFVAALPGDGAVAEGYGYWWEGVGRLLDVLRLVKRASGGKLDAFGLPSLRASVGFPLAMWLGPAEPAEPVGPAGPPSRAEHWCVNYSDSRAKMGGEPWHVLFAAAVEAGDEASAVHALRQGLGGEAIFGENDSLWRQMDALFDADWCDYMDEGGGLQSAQASQASSLPPGLGGDEGPADGCGAASPNRDSAHRCGLAVARDPMLPERVWLPSAQIMVAREAASGAGLTVSAKAGNNGDPHNHLDVGSFIVALDGVPFIVDAGRPTYTAQTFSSDRYELWMMRSQWHNLPEIAGVGQSAGSEFAATEVSFSADDETAELAFDLAGAYDLPAGRRGSAWRRRVRLDGHAVTVEDAWDANLCPPQGPPTLWCLLIAGEVRQRCAGRIDVKTLSGGRAVLRTEPGVLCNLVTKDYADPMLTNSWGPRLKRLTFDVSHLNHLCLTVTRKDGPTHG